MEEDFSNSSIWKKQFSQDGTEYYINKQTGQVKQPPRKRAEAKPLVDINQGTSSSNKDSAMASEYTGTTYIQQYTTDKVPFFVDMQSGVSTWTLPEGTPESAVKFITHLTDQGIPYYEDTATKTTSWTMPLEKLSTAARRSSMALRKMNRRQSNVFMTSANTETAAALAALRDLDTDDVDKGGASMVQNKAPFSTASSGKNDDNEGSVFRRKARSRDTAAAAKSSSAGGAPKRLSRLAASAQTQANTASSSSGGGGGSSGGGKLEDMRQVRANKRAQSLSSRSPVPGDDNDDGDDDGGIAEMTSSRKPFASAASTPSPNSSRRVTDSPTMSDVSSVTATSAGLVAGTDKANAAAGGTGGVHHDKGAFGMFGDSSCTRPLVRIVFEKYDKSNSGSISIEELQELCYDFGTYLSTDDLRVAMRELDKDGDGCLQYEEFMVWWRTNDRFSSMKASDAHSKLRQEAAAVFKKYDTDLSGDISRQEFAKLHRELQREKLVKQNLDNCIMQLDENGDGVIQFNEFISWIEKGPSGATGGASENKKEQVKRRNSLSKFFGALLGGGDTQEEDDVAHITTTATAADQPKMIKAKDHPDYAKFFRMADVGGSIVDIRAQMREYDLDDNMIQTPEKLISAESKVNVRNHLQQATGAAYLERVGEFDFHDDESDGMSSKASSVLQPAQTASDHVHDRDFTNMFRKKPSAIVEEKAPAVKEKKKKEPRRKDNTIVHIMKPLGITMGENEEDEEQGVHVASCAPNGNAAATGVISPGMILLEACGEDVRFKDFDDIMDILRGAPAEEPLKLIFAPAEGDEWETPSSSSESEAEEEEAQSVPETTTTPVSESIATNSGVSSAASNLAREELHKESSDEDEEKEINVREVTAPVTNSKPFALVEDEATSAPPEHIPPPPARKTEAPATKTRSPAASPSPSVTNKKSLIARRSAAAAAARSSKAQTQESEVPRQSQSSPPSTKPDASTSSVKKPSPQSSSNHGDDDDSSGDNWGVSQQAKESSTAVAADFGVASAVTAGGIFGLPDHLDNSDDDQEATAPQPTYTGNSRNTSPKNVPAVSSQNNPISRSPVRSPVGVHHGDEVDREWSRQEHIDAIESPLSSPTGPHEKQTEKEEHTALESSIITSRPKGPRFALLKGKGRGGTVASGNDDNARRATRGGLARVAPPQTNTPSPTTSLRKTASTSASTKSPNYTDAPAAGVFGGGMSYQVDDYGSDEDPPPPSAPHPDTLSTSPVARSETSSPLANKSTTSVRSTRSAASSTSRKTGGSSLGEQLKALRNLKRATSGESAAAALSVDSSRQHTDQQGECRDDVSARSGASQSQRSVNSRFSRFSAGTSDGGRSAAIAAGVVTSPNAESPTMSTGSHHTTRERDGYANEERSSHRHGERNSRYGVGGNSSGASSPSYSSYSGRGGSRSPAVNSTKQSSSGFSPAVTHKPLSSFDESLLGSSPSAPQLGSRGSMQRQTHSAPVGVQVEHRGMQSDYSSYVDEKYINSYQMLLGEKEEIEIMRRNLEQETEERAAMLLEQEEESLRRIAKREEESLKKLREEEDMLRDRVREVEDIILMERNEIDLQWEELRMKEAEADRTIKLRTKELLEVMHVVRAHHDKLHHDKKRIARQRLHLDMALHDLNRFNSFSAAAGEGGGGRNQQKSRSRPTTPTGSRRWTSPLQSSGSGRSGWLDGGGRSGGRSVGGVSSRYASPTKERAFYFGNGGGGGSGGTSRNGRR